MLALPELAKVDVRVMDQDLPMLFTVGGLRSFVVVSRWMLENLEDSELRAAFAHELAHVRHRDGLVMLLLRGLCPGGFGLPFLRQRTDEFAREFEPRSREVLWVTLAGGSSLATFTLADKGSPEAESVDVAATGPKAPDFIAVREGLKTQASRSSGSRSTRGARMTSFPSTRPSEPA